MEEYQQAQGPSAQLLHLECYPNAHHCDLRDFGGKHLHLEFCFPRSTYLSNHRQCLRRQDLRVLWVTQLWIKGALPRVCGHSWPHRCFRCFAAPWNRSPSPRFHSLVARVTYSANLPCSFGLCSNLQKAMHTNPT